MHLQEQQVGSVYHWASYYQARTLCRFCSCSRASWGSPRTSHSREQCHVRPSSRTSHHAMRPPAINKLCLLKAQAVLPVCTLHTLRSPTMGFQTIRVCSISRPGFSCEWYGIYSEDVKWWKHSQDIGPSDLLLSLSSFLSSPGWLSVPGGKWGDGRGSLNLLLN